MTSHHSSSNQQAGFRVFGTDDDNVPRPKTRVVHQTEARDVYTARSRSGDGHLNNTETGETGWLGNPYKVEGQGGDYSRKQSLALYCADLLHRIDHDPEFARALAQLKGQRLACYCRRARESAPTCHGDDLVDAIESLRPADASKTVPVSDAGPTGEVGDSRQQ
ncbi:DUF4326 domain-containing protein [Halococcus sediminicola]|uniref:DUF4326 domain-containing protein n=1 Tax=Halococcus sediminicola TaxID=1264579 RepID=UPI000678F7E4|nr:DUF4326 domain-containing protein [Halococcus sediminicola]